MFWIPIGAWAGALLLSAVVLGFCAYELNWKARRLQADLRRLQQLGDELNTLQDDIAAAELRLARTGLY